MALDSRRDRFPNGQNAIARLLGWLGDFDLQAMGLQGRGTCLEQQVLQSTYRIVLGASAQRGTQSMRLETQ
jgi:hypothetical protein